MTRTGTIDWRIVALLACASCALACRPDMDDERLNLLARDREFSNSAGDIDKVLTFYAPDASLSLPGLPAARGAANIRSAATKFASVPGFSIEWEPDEAILSSSRDLAAVTGIYRMTIALPNRPPTISGAYVEVWKRSWGEWKIVEHIFHPFSR